MELAIIEKNLSEYNQAIEFIMSKMVNSHSISDEQWKYFYTLLFNGGANSLVGSQIQRYVINKDWNVFWDLFFDFVEFVINGHSVMKNQLDCNCSQTETPARNFLQWLLDDCIKKIVVDYRKNDHSRKVGASRKCNLRLNMNSGEIIMLN